MPARGSTGRIFCTGLSLPDPVTANRTPLPYALAGVGVTIGGAPAPLFAVALLPGYQQINFQVPFEGQFQETQSGQGESTAVVIQQNGNQGSATAPVSESPGEFFQLVGTGYGIFQHGTDYSLVTKDNPAKPGEILVTYLTGTPSSLDFNVPTGEPAL